MIGVIFPYSPLTTSKSDILYGDTIILLLVVSLYQNHPSTTGLLFYVCILEASLDKKCHSLT